MEPPRLWVSDHPGGQAQLVCSTVPEAVLSNRSNPGPGTPAEPGLIPGAGEGPVSVPEYVYAPGSVTVPPSGLVTVTSTVPVPGGVSTVIWVVWTGKSMMPWLDPNVTVAPDWKSVPLMTVHCPPCTGPDVGLSPVMVGGTATAVAPPMPLADGPLALPRFEPACAGGTASARNSAPARMRVAVVREGVRGVIGQPPTRANRPT